MVDDVWWHRCSTCGHTLSRHVNGVQCFGPDAPPGEPCGCQWYMSPYTGKPSAPESNFPVQIDLGDGTVIGVPPHKIPQLTNAYKAIEQLNTKVSELEDDLDAARENMPDDRHTLEQIDRLLDTLDIVGRGVDGVQVLIGMCREEKAVSADLRNQLAGARVHADGIQHSQDRVRDELLKQVKEYSGVRYDNVTDMDLVRILTSTVFEWKARAVKAEHRVLETEEKLRKIQNIATGIDTAAIGD